MRNGIGAPGEDIKATNMLLLYDRNTTYLLYNCFLETTKEGDEIQRVQKMA
jgi:hypothetical protein